VVLPRIELGSKV